MARRVSLLAFLVVLPCIAVAAVSTRDVPHRKASDRVIADAGDMTPSVVTAPCMLERACTVATRR